MRWWPYEQQTLESPLSEAEIQSRLAGRCMGSVWKPVSRGTAFVGRIDEKGFRLVPIVWGQSSFMPQFFGSWKSGPAGTRIDLQIVPNVALLVCLLVVFAFMGILVYDRNWIRVVVTTGANALLAGLLLLVGFWVAVDASQRKLMKILNAVPVQLPRDRFFPFRVTWQRAASWCLGAAILAAGASLWWAVHSGRLILSLRPAIDLVTIAWTTLGLMVVWMFTGSGLSHVTRVRCLLMLFAIQIGWSWFATVDGFAGDGRPLFAWRWLAKDTMVDSMADQVRRSDSFATVIVDLHPSGPDDLPAFRGPRRDGVIDSIHFDPDWERHPPKIVWQQPIGVGWSSYAISGGFAVTQEQRGLDEAVVCYEIATGRECWEHRDRARFHEMMGGDGPRATPTLDEGDVYALGATGIFNRLRGQDGHPVWTVNIIVEAQAPASLFGMTGSPLIVNDLVVVNPGGPNASLVAYDKATGKRCWAAGSAQTAYASPQRVQLGGRDQILAFNAEGLFAHATEDGEILWSHPWVTPPEFNNVCQPVVWIDDAGNETVFLTSGYGKGCVLLEIAGKEGRFTAVPRWQNTNLKVKFSSVVARDGYVYGLDENILVCLNLRTGQRCWKGGRYGFGQLLLIDKILLVLSDYGEVVLCEATPDQHRELARLPVLNSRTWNHPSLSGDILLIRNDRTAACLKLPLNP